MSLDDALISQRVDALVERGLDRYGSGDLRGAMSEWEHALALDPEHKRAREYISYVEDNFDVLEARFGAAQSTRPAPELGVPFGLEGVGRAGTVDDDDDDDDAYASLQLDVGDGAASKPTLRDSVDEGWVLDDYADALPPPPSAGRDLADELGAVTDGLLEISGGTADAIDLAPSGDFSLGPAGRDDGQQPKAASTVAMTGPPPKPAAAATAMLEGGAPTPSFDPFGSLDPLADDPFASIDPAPPPRVTAQPVEIAAAPPGGLDLDPLPGMPPLEPTREFGQLELNDPDDVDEEQTVEVRRYDKMRSDEEITVPGSEPVPPFNPTLPLSSDAIAALSQPRHGTAATDETTAERSGARGFALGDLDALEGTSPPDDRDLEFRVPQVTFRDSGQDDEEATRERAANDGLDDELTMERGAAHWSGSLGGVSGTGPTIDLPDPSQPAVIVDQSLLGDDTEERKLPDRPTAEFERDIETKDLKRQPISSPSLPGVGFTDEKVSLDTVAAALMTDVDRTAKEGESDMERTRRRVGGLIKRAESESHFGNHEISITCMDLALSEDPDSAAAQKLIHRHRDLILQIYQAYLSDMSAIPMLAMPMHELPHEQLDNRAAFLLSRIDGTLSFEEILDIAGMSHMEAYRYLCSMLVKGILEVR